MILGEDDDNQLIEDMTFEEQKRRNANRDNYDGI